MENLTKNKLMTTAEVCQILGCNVSTLFRNWQEIESFAAPAKVKNIENGKPTLWTEAEITLLLEKMKGNANNQHDLVSKIQDISTSRSRVLQLQILQNQMQSIYEAEIADLKAKAEADKPKIDFFDTVANSKDALQMRYVASVLNIPGWGRNNIFRLLRDKKVFDNQNIPYREFEDRGYFRVIERKWTDSEGETHIELTTLVYQKGIDFIRKLINKQKESLT